MCLFDQMAMVGYIMGDLSLFLKPLTSYMEAGSDPRPLVRHLERLQTKPIGTFYIDRNNLNAY